MQERHSVGVLSHKRFSVDDFHMRWQRARTAAVEAILGESCSTYAQGKEADLLALVTEEHRDLVLRKVFDNSRKLGLSVSRFLGLSWEVSDIQTVLEHGALPCLSGKWLWTKTGSALERPGCEGVKRLGSFLCDYWREAADGLVMGVGDVERYSRHASVGHGDASCVDVFFDDSLDYAGQKARHGAVPERVRQGLSDIQERLARMKATLSLDGISEGILYYRLESSEGPLCGASGRLLHESLAREVGSRFRG